MRGSLWEAEANTTSTSAPHPRVPSHAAPANLNSAYSGGNVFLLLARREVAPRTKHSTKRQWGKASKEHINSFGPRSEAVRDSRRSLISWVEAESLRHLSAKYCSLLPPPRSTIAAAFSHDGKTIASTHGDHTVKIIDCQTGSCLKVLSGHRRTPWVVRFHPFYSEIVASGSLDHEVRLWNVNTTECIGSHEFCRPIASLAFHAHGELLAVASGHKLYLWHYNKRGEASSPTVLLRTRRSLRAVHFHPHAFPFLLTAEVNDLDSSESSLTTATSMGCLRYPPPTVYLADAHSVGRPSLADELPITSLPLLMWPSFARDDGRISVQHTDGDVVLNSVRERVDPSASVQLLTYSTPSGQYELLLSPIDPNSSSSVPEETGTDSLMNEVDNSAMDIVETLEVQRRERNNHLFSFGDPTNWELPFLQGWLVGQSQAGQHRLSSLSGFSRENLAANADTENFVASSAMPINVGQSRVTGRSISRHRSLRSHTLPAAGSSENSALNNIPRSGIDTQPDSRIQSELASSLAAAAELPCTVKLRIWSHDIRDPCSPLDEQPCRLTIPHAVLCSEMGAHFSPCGRFLAACVACVLPHLEAETGLQSMAQNYFADASTSPTRHPILSRKVVYELRIYSLEEATFGTVLVSRAIRAAHCLTSIQFSPTAEHLLLAYGRHHSSLLKSVVIDGETTVPIYTILEVYRVSDMELVRVLSSAEDEVNVACFHPSVGGGLVYGTKEGKLRILQFESCGMNSSSSFLEENMLEVPTYALEC